MVTTILITIVLSIFSTVVMSYISMATPIGPWIDTTLVLAGMLIFRLLRYKNYAERLAFVTAGGSIGGILATGFGFSFPTLYFLDQQLFASWISSPLFFFASLAGLAVAAGGMGLWIANIVEHKLIVEEKLVFPVGELVQKMIAAQNQVRKAFELMVGFVSTSIFCFLQDGLFAFKGIIPKSLTLIPATALSIIKIPAVKFDILPFLWAIGFVSGHLIAIPLAVGAVARIFILEPINTVWFANISSMEFVLAFCSGMVVAGTISSLIELPSALMKAIKNLGKAKSETAGKPFGFSKEMIVEAAVVIGLSVLFLSYFGFSLLCQAYLLIFTFIWTYQVVLIAGKMGIAPLGRFATFVMVPALFLFNLDYVQIVFIATYVEVAGGVASDVLFGRKMGHLAQFSGRKIKCYQYLGLIVSSLCVGAIFWLLINHFGLGSDALFASKAQSRKLLIHAANFDFWALVVGFVFGHLLKLVSVNPMLVLGGLLMPLNISVGLIFGGMLTLLTKQKEEYYPLWSGVSAANSLWMLIKCVL
jgi:uncharacterized oligopeptide transporter (OPT) family protein